MLFSDLALSRRLERAEGTACLRFAEARRRLNPECGAAWIECAGAYAVFDGVHSPITQSFGLGIFEDLTPECLDTIEAFFRERGAPVMHEVSPLAGVPALSLLCRRNYTPVEISSVLFSLIEHPAPQSFPRITIRAIDSSETRLWCEINARAWAHEHPEFEPFLQETLAVSFAREQCLCLLAELDGAPAAAAALCLHDGVALFAGAATLPEFRRQGLQSALLHHRRRIAFEQGCDLAAMVAEAGSNSQRNAERAGFRVAYTRTKWSLPV